MSLLFTHFLVQNVSADVNFHFVVWAVLFLFAVNEAMSTREGVRDSSFLDVVIHVGILLVILNCWLQETWFLLQSINLYVNSGG